MNLKFLTICVFSVILSSNVTQSQVIQFGLCAEVETMLYFDIERFLGKWYEIERFPTLSEHDGHCAYLNIVSCGRRTIEIEHGFVSNKMKYIIHFNSSYAPGDDAIFSFAENNIDQIGIPLSVISTDYHNYAVVYGCKNNNLMGIKYLSAWILSRDPTMTSDIFDTAFGILTTIPNANVAYLETVHQDEIYCEHNWTAHIHAEDLEKT